MEREMLLADRIGGLVLGLCLCGCLAACHNNAAAEGIACGTTTCAAGQVCCIDCDGQGRCHSPGVVCAGAACEPHSSDAGTGADADTTNQVCCIDCDGKRTCDYPPFDCPGYACLEQDDGERCGTATCDPGSRCCEHCGALFCHEGSSCPASAAPCPTDRPTTEESCKAVGGRWIRTMKGDTFHCVLPTTDGGTSCTDSSQCQSWCQAPNGAKSGDEVTGTCYDWDSADCLQEVRKGKAESQMCA